MLRGLREAKSIHSKTMALSKERLQTEIAATEETIKKLEQIKIDSDSGIDLNNLVLEALKAAFAKA